MPSFEDWRRSYKEGVEGLTLYYEGKYGLTRARELALIEQNVTTKRAQDQLGELPLPFEVDNHYSGNLEKGISENKK